MHWAFLMQINLLFLICFLSSFTSCPLTTDNFFVHLLSFSFIFVCFTLLFLIQSVFFKHSVYLFSSFSFFSWFFWFYGRFCLFCSLFHSCLFFVLPWSFWLLTFFGTFCTVLYICLFCPCLSVLMGNLWMFNTLFFSCFFCPLLSHSLSIFCMFCKLFFIHLFCFFLSLLKDPFPAFSILSFSVTFALFSLIWWAFFVTFSSFSRCYPTLMCIPTVVFQNNIVLIVVIFTKIKNHQKIIKNLYEYTSTEISVISTDFDKNCFDLCYF